MTYNMRRVQQKLSNYPDFKILSHTVFPEQILRRYLEYANKMQADLTNWNFVTGKREDIYSIANSYFVNVLEDSTAQGGFLHSEYFILVDKEGRIRARNDDNGNNIGVYDGTNDHEVGLLIDDIKVLMAEYNLAKKTRMNKKDKFYIPLIVILSIIIPIVVAALMFLPDSLRLSFEVQIYDLYHFSCSPKWFNSFLLFVGFVWIKNKRLLFISVLMVIYISAIFLVSYIISKLSNFSTTFGGEG